MSDLGSMDVFQQHSSAAFQRIQSEVLPLIAPTAYIKLASIYSILSFLQSQDQGLQLEFRPDVLPATHCKGLASLATARVDISYTELLSSEQPSKLLAEHVSKTNLADLVHVLQLLIVQEKEDATTHEVGRLVLYSILISFSLFSRFWCHGRPICSVLT
jgi:hypothetical protein